MPNYFNTCWGTLSKEIMYIHVYKYIRMVHIHTCLNVAVSECYPIVGLWTVGAFSVSSLKKDVRKFILGQQESVDDAKVLILKVCMLEALIVW